MAAGQLARDVQPEPGAGQVPQVGIVQAVEALEDALSFRGGHPPAAVLHAHPRIGIAGDGHGYVRSLGGVRERVGQQGVQHPLHILRIGVHLHRAAGQRQLQPASRHLGSERGAVDRRPGHLPEVEAAAALRQASRLDPGSQEQVLDQRAQLRRLGREHVERVLPAGRRRPEDSVAEHREVADEPVAVHHR